MYRPFVVGLGVLDKKGLLKIDLATHNPHMYEMQRRGIYPGDQDLQAGLLANALGGNVDVSS